MDIKLLEVGERAQKAAARRYMVDQYRGGWLPDMPPSMPQSVADGVVKRLLVADPAGRLSMSDAVAALGDVVAGLRSGHAPHTSVAPLRAAPFPVHISLDEVYVGHADVIQQLREALNGNTSSAAAAAPGDR